MTGGSKLPPGLYVVYWKRGGSSLAAIGVTASGGRWIAPTNWITPADDAAKHWCCVERVELLRMASCKDSLRK